MRQQVCGGKVQSCTEPNHGREYDAEGNLTSRCVPSKKQRRLAKQLARRAARRRARRELQ